ncbi:MAG: sulfatase-like hydrolase/transferase [Alphaproteobacteria bacterium]|nr:sulfatase-like hydrolase/transferase [Alphaproteobacteria bacterium]
MSFWLAWALAACTSPAGPDIVVVTWDTVRADHVGDGATPHLDALAAEATTFTRARTPCPITLPAHASLLSGALPARHGARINGRWPVDARVPLLQEALAKAGWSTAAFVSASVLRRRYGLSRGFQVYDDALAAPRYERPGPETMAAAIDWLGQASRRAPVFLWVHLYDPHLPWDAPEVEGLDPYRAEIARVDGLTAELVDALRARGRWDETVFVVTSDHGEGLGEHGEATHGYFVYESTARVPLVVRVPGRQGVVDTAVSLVDLAPTLADLAGVPFQAQGRSLRPAIEGGALPAVATPMETAMPALYYGAAPVFAVVDAQETAWIQLPRPERYDLGADPAQTTNRYTPADAAALEAAVGAVDWAWPPAAAGGTADAETVEMLAALGYVAADPAAGFDGRVDPKDLTDVFGYDLQHREALADVPPALRPEALRLLQPGLRPPHAQLDGIARWRRDHGDPYAFEARQIAILDELGRRRAALDALTERVDAGRATPEEAATLAPRRADLDHQRALAEAIQRSIEQEGERAEARYDLGVTLRALEQLAGAAESLGTAVALHPTDDEARLLWSTTLLELGDAKGALEVLEVAPEETPALACAVARLRVVHLGDAGGAEGLAACAE